MFLTLDLPEAAFSATFLRPTAQPSQRSSVLTSMRRLWRRFNTLSYSAIAMVKLRQEYVYDDAF
jgi:hypothetical protein